MARIPLLGPDDDGVEPKAVAILMGVREHYGADYNVIKGLANHPDVLEAYQKLADEVLSAKRLTPAQSEIAYYTAAVANSCHY